jgi:hypothetical protein
MQKFYKFFTLTTLALLTIWFVTTIFSKGADQSVSAQTKQSEACGAQHIFVIEDGTARAVHLVYDFNRSQISIVQIQKGFNPPEVTVRSKPFAQ